MVLDAFAQRKAGVLAALQSDCGDRSRKGSVDAPVAALVARINAHPAVYTTSSCSGRITVFGEPTAESRAGGKKGGEWVYASHDPADPKEVLAAIHARFVSGDRLVLRFEPFILALEANNAAMGQRVLAAARAAGFRESGLTLGSGGRRVMVGVRCSLRLEVPVADGGAVLVPDSYLRYCVDLANDKFRQNLDRIQRFEQELALALRDPVLDPSAGPTAATPNRAPKAGAAEGPNGAPAPRFQRRDGASAGLAAVPARRRRGAAAGGGSAAVGSAAGVGVGCASLGPDMASASAPAQRALKTRQERLLGRIRALELRVGLALRSRDGGGGGGSSSAAERLTGIGNAGAGFKAAAALGAAIASGCQGAVRGGGWEKEAALGGQQVPGGRHSAAKAMAAAGLAAGRGAGDSGGVLLWRPVPGSPEQGTVNEAVPRWGHASVAHGHRIYLLGGYGGGGAHSRRSDVLVYNTRSRTWDELRLTPGAPMPPPRMGHTAVTLGGGDGDKDAFVLLLGGRTSPVDALSDVWILNLEARAWIQIHPEVDPTTTAGTPCGQAAFPGRYRHSAIAVSPPPRTSASMAALPEDSDAAYGHEQPDQHDRKGVAVRDSAGGAGAAAAAERCTTLDGWRIVVFGGRTADAVLGDTWVLSRDSRVGGSDLSSGWRWRIVAGHGEAPSPRKSHAACFVPTAGFGRMYVHGGTCGYGMHFSDTFYLDLQTYTWFAVASGTAREGEGAAVAAAANGSAIGAPPPACFSHTLNRWGPYLLLVGGYPTDHHRQLYVLDTRVHEWWSVETTLGTAMPTASGRADANAAVGSALGSHDLTAGPAAAEAAPAPALDFVPIRHCAEVVYDKPYDALYVMGGGAFCFSFGTVFGGCFELVLGDGALERMLAKRWWRPPLTQSLESNAVDNDSGSGAVVEAGPSPLTGPERQAGVCDRRGAAAGAASCGPAPGTAPTDRSTDTAAAAAAISTGGDGGSCNVVHGWVISVPSAAAKTVKDALKAAGLLDVSRRCGAAAAAVAPAVGAVGAAGEAAAAAAGSLLSPSQRRVLLPVTEASGEALKKRLQQQGRKGEEEEEEEEGKSGLGKLAALLDKAGAELVSVTLPCATKLPVSPAQRLRAAVEQLLRTAPGLAASAAAAACRTTASPLAMTPSRQALSHSPQATQPPAKSLHESQAAAEVALVSTLLADLPTRWERLGDLALLPVGTLCHPDWARVLAGGQEQHLAEEAAAALPAAPAASVVSGDEGRVTEGRTAEGRTAEERAAALLPLWRVVAEALGVARLARQAPVANTGTRDSRAVLLLGSHGWVSHREDGVTFQLDVTTCMFSSGNVTERTRMGWGRGLTNALSWPACRTDVAPDAAAAADGDGGGSGGKRAGRQRGGGAGGEGAGGGAGGGGGARSGWAAGETVVDLYCGIGYYTLPLLVVGCVEKVYACEWNPAALEALRRNLQQPALAPAAAVARKPAATTAGSPGSETLGQPSTRPSGNARTGASSGPPRPTGPPPPVACRCEVLAGDCRLTAPEGVADRVMLGLLPSSRGSWETAIRALKPDRGGWLHLHHNVTDTEEVQWLYDTMEELRRLAAVAGRRWELHLRHVERVKWYAPHIRHIVMDIECRPARHNNLISTVTTATTIPTCSTSTATVPTSKTAAVTAGSTAAATRPANAAAAAGASDASGSGTSSVGASCSGADSGLAGAGNSGSASTVAGGGSDRDGRYDGGSSPRWYEQPLSLLQPVRRVRGVDSREVFEADISPGREPVILEGLDLGRAPQLWNLEFLMSLPAAKSTRVSVHVTRDPSGCLDFVHKNFAFRTMLLSELMARMTGAAPPCPLSPPSPLPFGLGEGDSTSTTTITATTPANSSNGTYSNSLCKDDAAGGGTATTSAGEGASEGGGGEVGGGGWPELVPRGPEFGEGPEVLYLRSIGENPRREPADLSASFPSLAAHLRLPPLFPPEALHSSVLRISSPGLVLWTHYDVMDNLLVQICGTKRVLLWPPACHDALHVTGSSSPITHIQTPDLDHYPRYGACPPPLVAELQPGDVLFLPSLWLHNVSTTGSEPGISVNVFWRHLPPEFYHKKDLYGNRDLVQAEAADKAADEATSQLASLPPHYRAFYGARLLGRLQRELGLTL